MNALHEPPHSGAHPEHIHDESCAMAHGTLPAPTGDRRLVAVFASPVARELAHIATHVGYEVVVLEPDPARGCEPFQRVADASAAHLDDRTDVVVTDHARAELGDVLAAVLDGSPRWVGVMGSPRHAAPHIAALRALGVGEDRIAIVHRPIGLDIGSRSPAEIAVSTVAGLLADRSGRPGGAYTTAAAGVSELRLVLTADDFDRALGLYRDALGMTQVADYSAATGRAVVLSAGRAVIELADPGHAAYVDELEVGRRVAGRLRLAFEVADVQGVTDALAGNGATLVAPPTRTPWDSVNARLDTDEGVHLTVFGPAPM
jgi:catechol 2,3-dioxygenase-like lactoylglutathione lyase family enzyme